MVVVDFCKDLPPFNGFQALMAMKDLMNRLGSELDLAMVGPKVDLTYDYDHVGETTEVLAQLADGSHPYCARLAKAKNPVVIVGSEALQREDGSSVMAHVQRIA